MSYIWFWIMCATCVSLVQWCKVTLRLKRWKRKYPVFHCRCGLNMTHIHTDTHTHTRAYTQAHTLVISHEYSYPWRVWLPLCRTSQRSLVGETDRSLLAIKSITMAFSTGRLQHNGLHLAFSKTAYYTGLSTTLLLQHSLSPESPGHPISSQLLPFFSFCPSFRPSVCFTVIYFTNFLLVTWTFSVSPSLTQSHSIKSVSELHLLSNVDNI